MISLSKQRVAENIELWEKRQANYEANDFEMICSNWINQSISQINPDIKSKFFSKLDNWLFHTHAFLQGSSFQEDARARILSVGRVFSGDIKEIWEMKQLTIDQLTYIANQQTAKSRLYAFAQGGVTGTGGWLLLSIDFPLMVTINLRTVQLIGLTFGHEMNHPYEMMLSLKLFHAATLPKRLQAEAWKELVEEIKNKESAYVYLGDDRLTDQTWLEQPLKQVFKSLFIMMFRKKLFQGIPLISVAIGAQANYSLTKQVAEFATKFYQYRYLLEEEGN
ncbi:EcsC family protein [Halobacillus massiliensis]|uniref:EcsC family protein n=1 Tax=Halobacillus massiliensis TaxID=1926286 RepID=UPI003182DEBB